MESSFPSKRKQAHEFVERSQCGSVITFPMQFTDALYLALQEAMERREDEKYQIVFPGSERMAVAFTARVVDVKKLPLDTIGVDFRLSSKMTLVTGHLT